MVANTMMAIAVLDLNIAPSLRHASHCSRVNNGKWKPKFHSWRPVDICLTSNAT
jgi:hypothetical protein